MPQCLLQMKTAGNGKEGMNDIIFEKKSDMVKAIAAVSILLFVSYIFL